MKLYQYMAPPDPNETRPRVVYKSEQDILYDYWDYWKYKMEEKYGKNHAEITPENCIHDWVIHYHANEVKD